MANQERPVPGGGPAPVGLCPMCGEPVVRTPFGWCCDAARDHGVKSHFVIFGEIAGKRLPTKAVIELVQSGETSKELDFVSKNGKPFRAKLKLDPEQHYKAVFVFPEPETVGTCPVCGGNIIGTAKAYGCANWHDEDGGCKFVVWKEISGHTVTTKQAEQLLAGEEIGPFDFVSHQGKEFRARMRLDETSKVEFIFENRDQDEEDDDY